MATPDSSPTTSLSEAKAALGRKEFARAIEKATEVIVVAPKEAPAYLIRAEALRRLGKPERALADLAVAIRLQPDRPSAYVVRAEILKKRCQFDQAIADATQAIFLDPNNAAAYSIRATCRESIGDLDGASADHEELIRIDPTRPSIPQTGQPNAPSHISSDRPHPAIPEDDRHVFADGRKPDRSYRSRPAIGDDEAAEVLGQASGYKPGILPRAKPGGRTRTNSSSKGLGFGVLVLGLIVALACLVMMRGSPSSDPDRGPRSSQAKALQKPTETADVKGETTSKATITPAKPDETAAKSASVQATPPLKTEKKHQAVQVRQIRFSMADDGECRLLLDARDDVVAHEAPQGELTTLTGVSNGVVRRTETGTHRILHAFGEGGSTADFARLNGTSPLSMEGISIDRTAGTLMMTPIKAEKSPGKKAQFGYPRLVKMPIALVLDFDKLDGGTFVLQLGSQIPTGTIAINVAPDRNRGDIATEVALFPINDGKRGKATNLLTRRFEAEAVSESGFQLPSGNATADDRFLLEFGLHGEEPVTIRRLEVEAKIPASFGLSLELEKGAVKVKSALKGGAAEKAGFKAGDILVSMGGEKLSDLKSTMARMAEAPIGKDITFVIRRAGQEKTIVVKGE